MSLNNNSRAPFGGLLNIPIDPQVLKKFKLENSQIMEQAKRENRQGKPMIVKQLPNQEIGSFVINQMLQRMQQCEIAKEKQKEEFIKKSSIAEKLIKDYFQKSNKLQKQLEELRISTSKKILTLEQRLEPMEKKYSNIQYEQIENIIERQKKSWKVQKQCLMKLSNIINTLKFQVDQKANQPNKSNEIKENQTNADGPTLFEVLSQERISMYDKLTKIVADTRQQHEKNKKKTKKDEKQLRKSLDAKQKQVKTITEQLESIKQSLQEKDKQKKSVIGQLESTKLKLSELAESKKAQFQEHQQQIQSERKNLQPIIKLFEQRSLVNVNFREIQEKADTIKASFQSSHFQKQLEKVVKIMTEQYLGRRKQFKQNSESVHELIKQTKRHFSLALDSLLSREKGLKVQIVAQQEQISELCKICMDKPLEMIYTSCNHIISCQECSTSLNNECSICKKKDQGEYKKFYKM